MTFVLRILKSGIKEISFGGLIPIFLLSLMFSLPAQANQRDCVILLHGLGRTNLSMLSLELELRLDFHVVNSSYPSTSKSIDELSYVVKDGVDSCREKSAAQIHFVTHSLGGILVRKYFQDVTVPEARRVVMLGPPNHGSEVAEHYKDSWWYKFATGPAGQELGTHEESLPNTLKPIQLEVGIIAGTKSSDPWFSYLFEGAGDGKVSVSSTALEEMKDFIIVHQGHTFIANSPEVIAQVQYFLAHGKFNKGTDSPQE